MAYVVSHRRSQEVMVTKGEVMVTKGKRWLLRGSDGC